MFIFIMISVHANYTIVAFELEKLSNTGLKLVMTICIIMYVALLYTFQQVDMLEHYEKNQDS